MDDPSQHAPFPRSDVEGSVVDRFEKIASRFADRIAVKYQARSLTYAELNTAANRVAGMLLSRDGGAAEPVGCFSTRTSRPSVPCSAC